MKSLYFSRKSVLINMNRVSIVIYLLFALSNWVLQLPAAPPPLTFEMSSLHSANAKSGVGSDIFAYKWIGLNKSLKQKT